MPWEHCSEKILDDDPCPKCGITKAKWTVEWNVTRTFQVKGGKPSLKFILHDANGKPIPRAAYAAKLPDGSTVEGSLDASGSARIDTKTEGACVVRFPGLDLGVWERKDAPS